MLNICVWIYVRFILNDFSMQMSSIGYVHVWDALMKSYTLSCTGDQREIEIWHYCQVCLTEELSFVVYK